MASAIPLRRDNSAAELRRLAASDRAVHGVVRWRRIDLKQMIADRFGVVYHERPICKPLKQIGFSHVSARLSLGG